jgi:amidohydrolase
MVFTVKSAKPIDLQQIRPEISDLQTSLVDWRRRLHQKPELAFEEQITSELIQQKLQEWNIPYQGGIAQTGVVAIIESDRPGKVLAIRADMDALPIQEANEVAYKSQHEGKMHACGHDGHTAIALGTAYYLQQHLSLIHI